MPYRIRIPEPTVELIQSIRPKIESRIVRALASLGDQPRLGFLASTAKFGDCMAFEFQIGSRGIRRCFSLLWQYDSNELDIHVFEFREIQCGTREYLSY